MRAIAGAVRDWPTIQDPGESPGHWTAVVNAAAENVFLGGGVAVCCAAGCLNCEGDGAGFNWCVCVVDERAGLRDGLSDEERTFLTGPVGSGTGDGSAWNCQAAGNGAAPGEDAATAFLE